VLAVLVCPLFWCRPLVIGFLPFVAAIPPLLFAIAFAVRHLREPSRGKAIAFALLSLLVFYLHLAAYVVLVTVTASVAFVGPDVRRRIVRLWPLAPSLGAVLFWIAHADRNAGPQLLAEGVVRGPSPGELGALFAAWTHDIWQSHVDEVTGFAFWAVILFLAWQRATPEPESHRGLVRRWIPFVVTLVLFVLLPYRVGAGAMINVRLAVLLALFAVMIPRPNPGRTRTLVGFVGVGLSAAVAASATWEIRASLGELGDFDEILAAIRPGARVLTLDYERSSNVVHGSAWIHAPAYHRLRQGGVAAVSFSGMAHWPVQFRPDARPPAKTELFWDYHPCLFRNAVDGTYYDYVLVRGTPDPFVMHPTGPSWTTLREIPGWRLFGRDGGTWEGGSDRTDCP